MKNHEKSTWSDQWSADNSRWPDMNLVRMLKGSWPECNFDKEKYKEQRIVDVGCGDASNFPLFRQCGFKEICGVEISDEICEIDNAKMQKMGIDGIVKKGTNDSIPFPDAYFDYMVSWNALYYMGWANEHYFHLSDYVREFARCLKKDGIFMFSVPDKTHALFRNCEEIEKGYAIIRNDRLNIRNGFVFYRFEDEDDIEKQFSEAFTDFHFGNIRMKFFGINDEINHTIGYCRKK